MNNPRKILFLMPSLVGGGAERTLVNLLNKIDFSRYEIDLVIVSKFGEYIAQVPKQVKIIPLFNSNFIVRILAYLQKKFGFNGIFKKMVELKITGHYDVAISFLDGNFTDLLFFIKHANKRYAWVHSSYKSNHNFSRFYDNDYYRQKLIRKRYDKLDAIYFVSHDAKNEFIEIFGEYPKMEVVYNLIDSDSILNKSIKTQNQALNEVFKFLAIGSLLPVKGFDRLIRASKIVKEKGLDFR